jgi:hypothetical protein
VSATATLLAEDSPTPSRAESAPKAKYNTVYVASARWVPVFWMFCFEADDLTDVELDGEQVPTLTSPMRAVRERLAAREAVAREWFPGFVGLWVKWREAIGRLEQQYLKLDSYALSCMGDHRDFASGLFMALDGPDPHGLDLEYLLDLACIEGYDEAERSFRPPPGYEPEGCLAGYDDDVVIWDKACRPARKRRRSG